MLPHGGLDLRPGFTLSHMEWLSSGVDLVELEVGIHDDKVSGSSNR